MSSTATNIATISSTKSHSQSWYRNRNNKRFSSLPRRKYPRRSQRLALITKAKTFTHPPECMPVATSQSSIDANVTYGFSNNKNRELRHIPNGASFKEHHVNNVLHFRWNARITGYQYLADWKDYSKKDQSFTGHVDNCAKKIAVFYVLRFKKRLIEHEETRIQRIRRSNQLMMPEKETMVNVWDAL